MHGSTRVMAGLTDSKLGISPEIGCRFFAFLGVSMRFVCAWCNREHGTDGQPVGESIPKVQQKGDSHGICWPCMEREMPSIATQVRARLAKRA